jgi:hypothetical protein
MGKGVWANNPERRKAIEEEDRELRRRIEQYKALYGDRAPTLSEEYESHLALIKSGGDIGPKGIFFGKDPFPGYSLVDRLHPFFRESKRLLRETDALQSEASIGLLRMMQTAQGGAPLLAGALEQAAPSARAGFTDVQATGVGPKYCSNCGMKLESSPMFCAECGAATKR